MITNRVKWLLLSWTFAGIVVQAQGATETVVHNFGDFPNGALPYGTLARGPSGNFYGTTYQGGATNMGAVFEVTATGKYKVLYSFRGGADGANPYAGLASDSAGNLYGTTYNGGASGLGTVYKVNSSGQESVLYSFAGGADGANPYAGVTLDSSGNLYGTTYYGGAANSGVVYKLTSSGQETILYSFSGGADGSHPYAGVALDPAGNLYGTTLWGGSNIMGTVYKVSASGQERVLHTFGFGGANDGGDPLAGVVLDAAGNLYGAARNAVYEITAGGAYAVLYRFPYATDPQEAYSTPILDRAGNLYGTTTGGGPHYSGTVYEVEASGNFKTLYAFPGGTTYWVYTNVSNPGVLLDPAGNLYGATPYAGAAGMVYKVALSGHGAALYTLPGAAGGTAPAEVLLGASGELYGTTSGGGTANAGVVYKMTATGQETVLHSFAGGNDGAHPSGGLAVDSAGNVYGTTVAGGAANEGVVYKVSPSGQETILHTFTGGADGGLPNGVTMDSSGNLYGTTFGGGSGGMTGLQEGVVFKIDPSGQETVLYSFTGLSDGGNSAAGVVLDAAGNLYGTTFYGGLGAGVIYQVTPAGQETVLYAFGGGASGANPEAGVIRDAAGNLYGTTANSIPNGGVVYELSAGGAYSVLYTFGAGAAGGAPLVGVVRDRAGNLYGATSSGGTPTCYLGSGCGTVYELSAAGQITVLHSFTGGSDGSGSGAVILDPAGALYGPAGIGAAGGGLVYRLTPQ